MQLSACDKATALACACQQPLKQHQEMYAARIYSQILKIIGHGACRPHFFRQFCCKMWGVQLGVKPT